MSDLRIVQADELAPGVMGRVLDGDLDATVQALEALEIPLKHDLALPFLRELQESRATLDQMVTQPPRATRAIEAVFAVERSVVVDSMFSYADGYNDALIEVRRVVTAAMRGAS